MDALYRHCRHLARSARKPTNPHRRGSPEAHGSTACVPRARMPARQSGRRATRPDRARPLVNAPRRWLRGRFWTADEYDQARLRVHRQPALGGGGARPEDDVPRQVGGHLRSLCCRRRDRCAARNRPVGTTRSASKGRALRAAGVWPVVVDVFDLPALSRGMAAAPDAGDGPPPRPPLRHREAFRRQPCWAPWIRRRTICARSSQPTERHLIRAWVSRREDERVPRAGRVLAVITYLGSPLEWTKCWGGRS